MKRLKRIALLFVPIFIISGVILACGDSAGGAGTVVTPESTGAPSQKTYTVGQTVALDGWEIKVNSVKESKGDDISQPKSGNIYLEVSVTLKNTSTKAQTVSSIGSFKLADSSGQSYTESIVTNAPNPPDGTVAVNAKVTGTLSYEVPSKEKQFTLSFSPDLLSNDQATWSLSVK